MGLVFLMTVASVLGFVFRMMLMVKGAQQVGQFVQEMQRYAVLSQRQELENMYRQIAYFVQMQQQEQAQFLWQQAEARIHTLPGPERTTERSNLGAVVERRKVLNPRSGEWEDAA
jgi:hypothetical protein